MERPHRQAAPRRSGSATGPRHGQGDPTITEPPEHLDYDLWCVPSEKLPYTRARHHRWWRWHRAYGGGNVMDWIGHFNDIAHCGMDMERSGPVAVEATGNWTWATFEGYNTPVDYEIQCRYANGAKWIGEDGWILASPEKQEASNPALLAESFDPGPIKAYSSTSHHDNFLDGIRTRTECIAPAEIARRSITPGHLAIWPTCRRNSIAR